VLSAKAPVWLRIDDAHGNVIVTTTLNAGDSYRVPNRDGLVIISRDGGRIAYTIDGKAKGELGRPGEILVGRSLDLKKLAGL
jgi:cytoskeleton protein RodZ